MMIKQAIESKLQETFSPLHFEVVNESHMHSVPPGSESHFKLVIVSERFEGLSLLKRHRLVNEALAQEVARVRAISLTTLTRDEWAERGGLVAPSPTCAGGSKRP